MDTSTAPSYRSYRFPPGIIAHCVWLYFRFSLSFRDIQELMLERGIEVSYEAIRLWCVKFGAQYARRLGRRRGRPGDTWYLDEVFCKINGQLLYLWRAVDQSGEVLDILVQKRRDAKAAKRFFRKLLKALRYVPRAIVTDKLTSYTCAGGRNARSGSSSWAAIEQPGRELAPAHSRARTSNATIQVDATRPALPLSAWAGLESLPTGATPHARVQLSDINDWAVRILV